MPKASALQFCGYSVDYLIYKDIPDSGENDFQLSPHFKSDVKIIDDNNYDVTLSLSIEPEENVPAPFELSACLTGHFFYDDPDNMYAEGVKHTMITQNTSAILLPYMRALITTITANCNISPVILPILDLTKDGTKETEKEELE